MAVAAVGAPPGLGAVPVSLSGCSSVARDPKTEGPLRRQLDLSSQSVEFGYELLGLAKEPPLFGQHPL